MLKLITPCEKYLASYAEAYDEYASAGIKDYSFTDPRCMDVLQKFDDYRYERNLKPNRVGADFYWLVEEDSSRFIGEITIRHRLNEQLERIGGHIGYGVRITEQGKGMGTLMLKLALEKAREMGLARVLITCDDNNIASARVMEKNGCILMDKVENIFAGKKIFTRRYVCTL